MFPFCEIRRTLVTNPTGFLWTLALLPTFMLVGAATRLILAVPTALSLSPLVFYFASLAAALFAAVTRYRILLASHGFFQTVFTFLFVLATARATHRRSYVNRFLERFRHPDHYGYTPDWFEAGVLNCLARFYNGAADTTISAYWLFCRLVDPLLFFPHLYMWVRRGGTWRSHRAFWLRPHYNYDLSVPNRPYMFELWWVGLYWQTHPLLPESGGLFGYQDVLRFWGRPNYRKHEKLIVQVLLFATNAGMAEDWAAVLRLVPLTLNGVLDDGVLRVLLNYINSNLDGPMPQNGAWKDFKSAVKCWGQARDSPFVKRFEKLIYVSIATGLMASVGVNVTDSLLARAAEGSKDLLKRDISDSVLYVAESVIHFVDSIAHYMSKDGSYRSFFMRSFDATELDDAYTFLIAHKDLFFAGCLEKADSSEAEYLTKLEFVRSTFKTMNERGSLGHVERTVLGQRIMRVEELKASVVLRSTQQTMRPAPYVVKLFSQTAQGKSVFVDEMQSHILRANGFPTNREYCATVNEEDKFDSTVKSNTVVIRMDDFPKITPEHAKNNPVDAIMRIANNELTAAVKAELDQKGTVFFNNRLLMITTNKADLYAPIYSVEPAALMRRINVHATFVVRPEFRNHLGHLDAIKIREHPDSANGKFVDAHVVSVEEWRLEASSWALRPVKYCWPELFQEKFGYPAQELLVGMTTNKFLHYLTAHSRAHFAHQATLLQRADHVYEDTTCPECLVSTSRCPCPPAPQVQASIGDVRTALLHGRNCTLSTCVYLYHGTWRAWRAKHELRIRLFISEYGERLAVYLLQTAGRTAIAIKLFDLFIVCSRRIWLTMWFSAISAVVCATLMVVDPCFRYFWLVLFFAGLAASLKTITVYALSIYASHRGFFWARSIGAARLTRYFAYFVTGAAALRAMYSYYKPLGPTPQGGAVSAPAEFRPWAAYSNARPVPSALLTTTPMQTKDVIGRQLAHITVTLSNGRVRTGNGLIVCSNFLLANKHTLELPDGVTAFMSLLTGPERWGANMKKVEVSERVVEDVLNPDGSPTDLVVVHLQGGGARRDLTAFMSKGHLPYTARFHEPRRLRAFEMYRGPDAALSVTPFSVDSCPADSELGKGIASLRQQRSTATFPGLCGSVTLTDEGGKTVIAGLHYLGSTADGFSTQVAGPWVQDAMGRLLARSRFLARGAEVSLTPECFTGSTHRFTNDVHYKSGAHSLSADAAVGVLGGSTIPRVQPRSNIVDLPMADAVLRHCPEVVRTHEPPSRMGDPAIFTENLAARVDNDAQPFPTLFFQQAFDDLLMCDERATVGRLEKVVPLSDMEILTGRAGCKGIEPLDLSTSMGLPFRKKKNLYMVRSPTPGPDGLCPVEVDQTIWDEFHRLDDLVRQGKRVHLLFDAVAKDEQVKIGKKKVRVITGVNIFLSMLFRKYYLPLMTVETADTFEFEHAVWIRPATLDWTRLANRLLKRDPERLILGDFGGFDTSAKYQSTRGGMRIYEERGLRAPLYTAEDLEAMRILAEEICNAWANFDGTIYEFWNSILSGHNGTVMLNNKVNALDMRSAFYELLHDIFITGKPVLDTVSVGSCSSASSRSAEDALPESLRGPAAALDGRTFSDFVTLVTYGDDMVGSVSKEIGWYNAQTISMCLARHGLKFTDANKEVPSQPFYRLDEVDFLKRQFRWDDDRQVFAAPLAWSSVTKCLLAGMPPKPSTGKGLEEHCADLIKSQLAEAFEHGPDVYNSLASGLQSVVDELDYGLFFNNGRVRTYAEQQEVWDERAYNGADCEAIACYGMSPQAGEHHAYCLDSEECVDLFVLTPACDDRGLQVLGHAATATGHARPPLRVRAAVLLRKVRSEYVQRIMLIADPIPARSHDAVHYEGPPQGRVHHVIIFMDMRFSFMGIESEPNQGAHRLDLRCCPAVTLERAYYLFRRLTNYRTHPVIFSTYAG